MASDLRSVSGRRLNFQKTQLEIRFNIPPRKSAVKKGVENAVEKKVKNFSLENLEIRRKNPRKNPQKNPRKNPRTNSRGHPRQKPTAKIHGRRKGYGTKGGGEDLEVFLFLLSGEGGATRFELVIKCQHHSKIHSIEKKSAPKIRLEVQGDDFL